VRLINFLLLLLAALLSYRLIFGHNGVNFYNAHRQEVTKLKRDNEQLVKRNELIAADVNDLTLGLEGIEERARNELGMIRENETFFRVVTKRKEP
jgi:cell division protein FtsB